MLKELIREGNKRYFLAEGEEGNILFSFYEWNKECSIDEIETALLLSDIPSYLQGKYTLEELLNEPLAIFELEIISNRYEQRSTLKPTNMSLWEYETFIKNNFEIPKALKMAFITQEREEGNFYIACESYDSDSMVTKSNMKIANSFVARLYKELEKVTNKRYSHTESY